jgi:hypothetical protein
MLTEVLSKRLLNKNAKKFAVNYLALVKRNGATSLIGSDDGVSWRGLPTAPLPTGLKGVSQSFGEANSIVYGNGKYVIAGKSGIIYSENGYDWKETSAPVEASFTLRFANGRFFLFTGADVYVSTNLSSWTKGTMPTSDSWNSIAYHTSARKYIAVCDSCVAYSSNGTSWSKATTATKKTSWYSGVVYSEGKAVATLYSASGDRVNLEYSSNATAWTAVSAMTGASNYIFYKASAAPQSKVLLVHGSDSAVHPLMAHTAGTTTVTDLEPPARRNDKRLSFYDLKWYSYRYYLVGAEGDTSNGYNGVITYSNDNGESWSFCNNMPEGVEVVYRIVSNLREG